MATNKERDELHKTIWNIANDLRGAVDGWSFKAYVLGAIFYRYISENLAAYINKLQEDYGCEGFDYAKMSDEEAEAAKEDMVKEKGFFMLPSQLFCNVVPSKKQEEEDKKKDEDSSESDSQQQKWYFKLNEKLKEIFAYIESSAAGTESAEKVRGLFADFAVDNTQIGSSIVLRNKLLGNVLIKVRDMKLQEKLADNGNDTFGDTYEYLMGMYAANAGKSGGEFFTPQEVSEVLARIAVHDNPTVKSVYDPACGSGSLLMKFAKTEGKDRDKIKYYGQEINPTTYNLCRINMFLHNINYGNFDIKLGDTLHTPMHLGMEFDAIVSNPPYSTKWDGKDNQILINDDRYSPAGVLAPKNAADLAFTMHMLHHLKETGTCAIVEFPGVLYRGGAEQTIRQYLVKKNRVDTIIQLPQNLFFGVTIATCIIVLRKGRRPDNSVLFIDASELFVKSGNKNILNSEHQDAIVKAYAERKEIKYFTKLVSNDDILANDCNLSVSSYVEKEDKREKINIGEVNYKLNCLSDEISQMSEDLDFLVDDELDGHFEEAIYLKENNKAKFKEWFDGMEKELIAEDPKWEAIFKED